MSLFEFPVSAVWGVLSAGDRTNDPCRVSPDKSICGNVLSNYRACRNDGVFADRHSPDDRGAGSNPDVSFNHYGLCDYAGAPLRRFKGMARRDDTHVWADHDIVRNFEPAKVIKSAVLIDENIAPDSDIDSAGCVERWDQ